MKYEDKIELPKVKVDLEVVALLQEGKRRLIEKGWIQGKYESGGGYCMMGSIHMHDWPIQEEPHKLFKVMVRAGHLLEKITKISVPTYNDEVAQSRGQVLEIFDKAINKAMGVK